MVKTLPRMVTLLRLVQPENVLGSICVTPAGMVTLTKDVQRINAYSPMTVTVLGMAMLL